MLKVGAEWAVHSSSENFCALSESLAWDIFLHTVSGVDDAELIRGGKVLATRKAYL